MLVSGKKYTKPIDNNPTKKQTEIGCFSFFIVNFNTKILNITPDLEKNYIYPLNLPLILEGKISIIQINDKGKAIQIKNLTIKAIKT